MHQGKWLARCLVLLGLARACKAVAPPCPATTSPSSYVTDPNNACLLYVCVSGMVTSSSPNLCPANPGWSMQLIAAGLSNPCANCNYITTPSPVTTTTAATVTPTPGTTTMPATTTAGPPTKSIVSITTGVHIGGGTSNTASTTFNLCINNCLADTTCVGLDWDRSRNLCWFHTATTECNAFILKDNCTHIRCTVCPTTPAPVITTTPAVATTTITPVQTTVTVVTNPTTLPFIQTFAMMHIPGGTEMVVTGSNLADACINACRMTSSCYGVDFDSNGNKCWFHGATTICNPMVFKATCSHYRVKDTCSTTTLTPTVTPTPTTAATGPTVPSTAAPGTTTDTATTTVAGNVTPNGFFASSPGMHIIGGMRVFVQVSQSQCTDACLMESFCLAVDYNSLLRTCYLHFQATYCNTLVPEAGTIHFSRLPCITGVNKAVEIRLKFHVLGGTLQSTGTTFLDCLTNCYNDATSACQGIDFDQRDQSCYFFTSANVCDELVPKDFCTHVTLVQCTFSTVSTTASPTTTVAAATTTPAPTSAFIALVFPGPTTLPSGYQTYPGMQIDNGEMIGVFNMDGDQCVAVCNADAACLAADFNSADGSCWSHDTTRKCNMLNAQSEIYHFKKPPPCTVVTGTTTPYPTPVEVIP